MVYTWPKYLLNFQMISLKARKIVEIIMILTGMCWSTQLDPAMLGQQGRTQRCEKTGERWTSPNRVAEPLFNLGQTDKQTNRQTDKQENYQDCSFTFSNLSKIFVCTCRGLIIWRLVLYFPYNIRVKKFYFITFFMYVYLFNVLKSITNTHLM